jgi:hypothetical protein
MASLKTAGSFTQLIYSPRGSVEGFLLKVGDDPVQFVLDKHDEHAAALVATLAPGQQLIVTCEPTPPSAKGEGDHPVHALEKLVSIDGAVPRKVKPGSLGYTGLVARFNYAKHGAPNGYVLDSGDFIHVKPDGFARLKLRVGDRVKADGDAHFLATGSGWAVEATSVNGKKLRKD